MPVIDYEKNGVLREFITPRKAKKLADKFINFCEQNALVGDEQVPTSYSAYNFIPFVQLLCSKTKEVGKILGEPVIPTYTYARVYKKGSVLTRHKDRDACEISITLNLKKDINWPIFINDNKSDTRVELNPGDGLLYEGCEHEHWRNEYNGDEYVQVFLHYVRAKGKRSWAYFDKHKTKEESVNTSRNLATTPTISLSSSNDKKLSDYIYIIEDVFDDEECKFILDEYTKHENEEEWQVARVGAASAGDAGLVNKGARDVDEIPLSLAAVKDRNPNVRCKIDDIIFSKVNHLIKMYKEKFPLVEMSEDSGYMLLRYTKDQHYIQHVDDFKEIPRTITCSIQLNDEFEGGEFAFFDREVVIKQKKGTAILFPSCFLYPHEVIPVTKGTRYAIVTWLR